MSPGALPYTLRTWRSCATQGLGPQLGGGGDQRLRGRRRNCRLRPERTPTNLRATQVAHPSGPVGEDDRRRAVRRGDGFVHVRAGVVQSGAAHAGQGRAPPRRGRCRGAGATAGGALDSESSCTDLAFRFGHNSGRIVTARCRGLRIGARRSTTRLQPIYRSYRAFRHGRPNYPVGSAFAPARPTGPPRPNRRAFVWQRFHYTDADQDPRRKDPA